MLITTTTGQENFPNCGCKVYLFAIPTAAHRGGGKETHVAYAAKEAVWPIRRHGATQMTPAAPNHIDEYGKWFRTTFDIADGVLLKLFAQRKVAEQVAGRHQGQVLYLRAREGAPLYRVTARTTGSDIGQYNTVHTEGRFDILDIGQVTALGVGLSGMQRSYMGNAGLITYEQIAAGTEAAPVVTAEVVRTPGGEEVVIHRTRRARALDL